MSVVLVTLAATLCMQVGYFLWKLSANRLALAPGTPARQVAHATFTDPRWLIGTVATTAGWVLFVQATALGEISLVQPLMSVGDLALVLLAVAFLGERLRPTEWAGVLLLVVGAAALSLGARTGDAQPTDVMALWTLLAGAALAAGLLIAVARRGQFAEAALAAAVGIAFGSGAILTEALTAGQASINVGLLAEPLLAGVVAANVGGLVLLHTAFRHGRAAVVVPLQLAVASLVSVVGGVLVFNEQVSVGRAAAVLVIVLASALLNRRAEQTAPTLSALPARLAPDPQPR